MIYIKPTVLALTGLMLWTGCNQTDYPSGRDTVESFGRGRFQIFPDGKNINVLYDIKLQKTIVHGVKDWHTQQGSLLVLGTGAEKFTVLDAKSGVVKYYSSIEAVPQSQKAAFERLEQHVK